MVSKKNFPRTRYRTYLCVNGRQYARFSSDRWRPAFASVCLKNSLWNQLTRSRVMLPLRVFERIVAIERPRLSPVTRSIVSMLPWRELNLAVGGTPFGVRKHFFFDTLPSRNICTISCVGNGVTRGSSDQEPACAFSDRLMCGRPLYIPRIASRFVYITRPLTGWVRWVNGASASLFVDGETGLAGGAGE